MPLATIRARNISVFPAEISDNPGVPHEHGSKYERALRQVVSGIQVLIYRREPSPIRDKDEVHLELALRLNELNGIKHDKLKWRRQLLELGAYCTFAAASDEE